MALAQNQKERKHLLRDPRLAGPPTRSWDQWQLVLVCNMSRDNRCLIGVNNWQMLLPREKPLATAWHSLVWVPQHIMLYCKSHIRKSLDVSHTKPRKLSAAKIATFAHLAVYPLAEHFDLANYIPLCDGRTDNYAKLQVDDVSFPLPSTHVGFFTAIPDQFRSCTCVKWWMIALRKSI